MNDDDYDRIAANLIQLMWPTGVTDPPIYIPLSSAVLTYTKRFGKLDYGPARTFSNLIRALNGNPKFREYGIEVISVPGRGIGNTSFLTRKISAPERSLAAFTHRVHALVPKGTNLAVQEIHGLLVRIWPDEGPTVSQTGRRMVRRHADCCQEIKSQEWRINTAMIRKLMEPEGPYVVEDPAAPGDRHKRGRSRSRSPPRRDASRDRSRDRSRDTSPHSSRHRSPPPPRRRSVSPSRQQRGGRDGGAAPGSRHYVPSKTAEHNARSPAMSDAYRRILAVLTPYCFRPVSEFFSAFKKAFGILDFKTLMQSVGKPDNFETCIQHMGEQFDEHIRIARIAFEGPEFNKDFVTRDYTTSELDIVSFEDQVHTLVPPGVEATVAQLWEMFDQVWGREEVKSIAEFQVNMERDHLECCRRLKVPTLRDEVWRINEHASKEDPVITLKMVEAAANSTFDSERETMLKEYKDPRNPRFLISKDELVKAMDKVLRVFENYCFVDEDSFLDVYRDVNGEPLKMNVFDMPVKYHMNYLRLLSIEVPATISLIMTAPMGPLKRSYVVVRRFYPPNELPFQAVQRKDRVHKLFPRGSLVPLELVAQQYPNIWKTDARKEAIIEEIRNDHQNCCSVSPQTIKIVGKQFETYNNRPAKLRPDAEELGGGGGAAGTLSSAGPQERYGDRSHRGEEDDRMSDHRSSERHHDRSRDEYSDRASEFSASSRPTAVQREERREMERAFAEGYERGSAAFAQGYERGSASSSSRGERVAPVPREPEEWRPPPPVQPRERPDLPRAERSARPEHEYEDFPRPNDLYGAADNFRPAREAWSPPLDDWSRSPPLAPQPAANRDGPLYSQLIASTHEQLAQGGSNKLFKLTAQGWTIARPASETFGVDLARSILYASVLPETLRLKDFDTVLMNALGGSSSAGNY